MSTSTTASQLGSGEQVAHRILVFARILGTLLIILAVFRLAWLSDDALITLRTALNITHNWGAGFNATESVQAYTHPMWFLIWMGLGNLTNQWILGILFTSIALTGFATGLMLWRAPSIARVVIITGILLFSNAFIEYATSGLENPLAFATLAMFIVLALNTIDKPSHRKVLLLGLIGSAVFLTRFDLILLILPMLAVIVWHLRSSLQMLTSGLLGLLAPLVAWFFWSQITYSTWLPNTYEAKRNVEIPAPELIVQGLRYFVVSFEHDPVTLIGLIIGLGAAILLGSIMVRAGACGVVLYLIYVTYIGGDFMAGRFLAVPLFVSMLLLASLPLISHETSPAVIGTSALLIFTFPILSSAAGSTPVSLSNPREARWEVDQNFNAGVSDERGTYVANGRDLKGFIDNLSLAFVDPPFVPVGDGTGLNRPLRNLNRTAQEWPVNDGTFTLPSEVVPMCGFLGTVGIVTGPTTHLVDTCALTDRYLAGRPYVPAEPFAWKPGHFNRAVLDGYLDAIATNNISAIKDGLDRFELEQLWNNIR